MIRTETIPTYRVEIFMAGDIAEAKRTCRSYCFAVGLCVTIEPLDYIYTGGEEAGFRIGLINYPRFPAEPEEIWRKALELAELLRRDLGQHSFSVVDPVKTFWSSRREGA